MSVYDIQAIEADLRKTMGADAFQDNPDPIVRAQGHAGEITIQMALWVMREQNAASSNTVIFNAAVGIVTSFFMNLLQVVDDAHRDQIAVSMTELLRSQLLGDGFDVLTGEPSDFRKFKGGRA